jgi:hypothetical protein
MRLKESRSLAAESTISSVAVFVCMLDGADMLYRNPESASAYAFTGCRGMSRALVWDVRRGQAGEMIAWPESPHVSLWIESDAMRVCQEVRQNKVSVNSNVRSSDMRVDPSN